MNPLYAPQRRLLLSLQQDESAAEPGLIRSPPLSMEADPGRQTALSVPESVRALGEPLDPFFEACGGRQMLSVAVRRTDDGTPVGTYVFQQPFVLIGRCTESDLALRHADVGFRHFYLQLISGRWSFVNLARLSKVASARNNRTSGWFDPGDELTVGPYTISHVVPESNVLVRPEQNFAIPDVASSPAVQLDLLNGRSESHRRRSRRLIQPITLIGAGRSCDLWLRDDSVSTTHASLVSTPRGVWIVDLLGRNGVWIDDRPAYWKQIHDGSELQIGRFRFRVRFISDHESSSGASVSGRADASAVARRRERRGTRSGSLSENAMLALVRQLAEMQSQFFEHSQLQMQMMSEMLAHLGRSQQTIVRRDLARIDDIGRELKEIQSQLAQPAKRSTTKPRSTAKRQTPPQSRSAMSIESTDVRDMPAGAVPIAPDAPELAPQSNVNPVFEDEQALPGPDARQPPELVLQSQPTATPSDVETRPVEAASANRDADATTDSSSLDAHARLTRRMARLAQERNNRWRRVLQAFKRKPAD